MRFKNGYYNMGALNEEGRKVSPFLLTDDGAVSFFIYCSMCGFGLCEEMSIGKNNDNDHIILIRPCPRCMENASNGRESEKIKSSLGARSKGLELVK